MQKFFITYFPIHSKLFSNYADIFAMSLCLILTVLLIIGIKESAVLNNVLTAINLIVTALVVVIGFTKLDLHNWNLSPEEAVNATGPVGHGGFFPFGIEGTLAGAATCFYAFVGFDLVATTGEETRNPQRAIPLSIGLTLFFCSIIYCLVSIVLTLMVYFDRQIFIFEKRTMLFRFHISSLIQMLAYLKHSVMLNCRHLNILLVLVLFQEYLLHYLAHFCLCHVFCMLLHRMV